MNVIVFVPSLIGLFSSLALMVYAVKTLRTRKRHLPPPPPPPDKPKPKSDPLEGVRKIRDWMREQK